MTRQKWAVDDDNCNVDNDEHDDDNYNDGGKDNNDDALLLGAIVLIGMKYEL